MRWKCFIFLYILFFNYAAFKLCGARNIDTASEVFSSQLKRGDILFSRYRIVEKLHQSDPTSGYNNAASLRFRQRAFSSSAIQPLDELPERTAGRFRVPEFQLPGLDAGPQKLGEGSFGAIYLATDSQTGGGYVTVKVPKRKAAEIRKEAEMLEAAWADARTRMTDVGRLGNLLDRSAEQLVHVELDRVSPLAVPVMVTLRSLPEIRVTIRLRLPRMV